MDIAEEVIGGRGSSAMCAKTLLIIVILGSVVIEELHPQGLAVPPPPRFPERGRGVLMLEGESTGNRPRGDETSMRARVQLSKDVRLEAWEIDLALGGEFDLGVSYQNDPDGVPLRVEQNKLRIGSLITAPLSWRVDPYVAGSLQTSVTEAFQYRRTGPIRHGKLWDPVVTTESAGGTFYHRHEKVDVSARVGFAFEQIRAVLHTDRTDDPATEGVVEGYSHESGVEFAGEATWRIDSNGTLESRVALFSTFEDLSVWRVHSENQIRVSFGGPLTFSWQVVLRHDVRETLRTQYMSGLALGVQAEL